VEAASAAAAEFEISHERATPPPPDDAIDAAKAAHLHYVNDLLSGITRERTRSGFNYRGLDGKIITDDAELVRIKSIAVPPAWTRVWICPDPNGHIQATGRDARGRKQYRYHPRWRAVRDETKFEHILDFGRVLPEIRRRVDADLALPGLPREKVLAAVVRLMERTLARIGNPEYARDNNSFGLTTLKNRHVRITRGKIELDFRAKHAIRHHSVVSDRKLARILKNCRDLPGAELFQYLDDNEQRHSVTSSDVNNYLREISGLEITAKDFRTWAATNLAVIEFCNLPGEDKPTKKSELTVIKRVAEQLGNTPAICRKCYIHPAVFSGYLTGALRESLSSLAMDYGLPEVWAAERNVIRFLRHNLEAASANGNGKHSRRSRRKSSHAR
jgi:DNA topoisomerase I